MVQSAAETHLSIIFNCARNNPLPNYYSLHVPWTEILSTWEKSSNDGLRITCKLLAGAIFDFLDEEQLHFLEMSDGDVLALLTALSVAASSSDSISQAFGYNYSTGELISILQYASFSTSNFHKIAKPHVLETLIGITLTGHLEERITSLKLLHYLLELPELMAILKSSHGNFLGRLQKEFIGSVNEDIVLWSGGILAAASETEEGKSVRLHSDA